MSGLTGSAESGSGILLWRSCARPRSARAATRRRAGCARTTGLRPPGVSGTERRSRRQQRRHAGEDLERSDRLGIHSDQPHQRVTQGNWRQRRGSAVDPHRAPQGPSFRRQRRGGPKRCSAAETSAYVIRQAIDRRITLRQYRRRSGAGVFCRWHGRGNHHGALSHPVAICHRPQFKLYLQGPRGRREAGRTRPECAIHTRRIGAQSGAAGAYFCSADRSRQRSPSLG